VDQLYDKALCLFVAYAERGGDGDPEILASIIMGMADKTCRIHMHQIMFALAYREFGSGSQEAFFRLVQEYNKTAPDGEHLGPKKFSSTKSLRAYLKKGQARVHLTGRGLRNYEQGVWERLNSGRF
jgi:hypothetical protein